MTTEKGRLMYRTKWATEIAKDIPEIALDVYAYPSDSGVNRRRMFQYAMEIIDEVRSPYAYMPETIRIYRDAINVIADLAGIDKPNHEPISFGELLEEYHKMSDEERKMISKIDVWVKPEDINRRERSEQA